jgi:hypothetical protein
MLLFFENTLKTHYNSFPEVTEFKDRVHRDCSSSDMTIRTILGRQRFIDNLYTQAINSVIQVYLFLFLFLLSHTHTHWCEFGCIVSFYSY